MTKEKGYELIISEKPRVSQKIAEAIATTKPEKKTKGKVSYYILNRNGKKIIVAPAVGHIFTLKEVSGSYGYPIFNIEWVPSHSASKTAYFTKQYLDVLKELAKDATSFVSACDYDIEGELIGYNVLKFACGEKSLENARRMKFSTLTKDELSNAYKNAMEHLDFNMAYAGIARHILDWYYGINTSRALSYAYKAVTGQYLTLSAGRVQTPTLKILNDRELEIQKFVSEDFWALTAILENEVKAIHKNERFFDKKEAEKIYKACGNKPALVSKIEKKKVKHAPPNPFNLGDLQSESYRIFRATPKKTQVLAQVLYEHGLISYPRTSSQKLPKIDIKDHLKKIAEQSKYSGLVSDILKKKELEANEGKKTDPAHPCIYPTGEKPKDLPVPEAKLYDMIVRRFLATFGEPAVRENQTVTFLISDEPFLAKGSITVEENWHKFYKPYVKLKEEELPEMSEGKELEVKDLEKKQDKTKPPSRYSQASIIKKMDQMGIGTKSTRAQILQTLYDRQYIDGLQIQVTKFGSVVIETLLKHVPELTSEGLTRKVEEEIEQIKEGKLEKDAVIKDAKEILTAEINKFKGHEAEIGQKLGEGHRKSEKERNELGPCPNCKSFLIIRVSRASGKQFVGCSGYPKCTTGFPLPQYALIVKTGKNCEHDNLPVIEVRRKGKRSYKMCIDPKCPSKADWGKKKKKTTSKSQSRKKSQPKP